MFFWGLLISLSIVLILYLYQWVTKNNDFFKKRHIAYDKPKFFFGSNKDMALRKKSVLQVLCEIYNKHDGLVYGTFDSRDPVLLIRDPELIKHIMIKDFQHFVNHRSFPMGNGENLLNTSVIVMENDKWRDMRNTLSPAFTGSKMRQMFQLMLQTVDEAMTYLRDQQKGGAIDDSGFELDIKDFTSRLTNDTIASTAFGLQVNSFRDKDNDFYAKAKKAINFTTFQQIKVMFIMLLPKVAQFLKLEIFDKAYSDYFMRLVLDAMQYRLENNIHRPDMINLLMEAKGLIPADVEKTHVRQWSDTELVAQCFLFFLAGFEPTSVVMSFAAHELMEYAEVQEKLFEEIQEVDQQLQGEPLSFETLQKMTYMDMVVSEVLRKWPVTMALDRACNKEYVYECPKTGERVEIKKGDFLRVASCAIQRDPKYYENPNVLNPERFNAENKSKIELGTYMPFGLGPRHCIANRFALLEVKAFLYYLLRDYRLEASPKTCIPLELDTTNVQLKPKTGFWLQLKPRK